MRWGFCSPPLVCDYGPMQSLSFPPLCLSVPYFIGQEGYCCVWGEEWWGLLYPDLCIMCHFTLTGVCGCPFLKSGDVQKADCL